MCYAHVATSHDVLQAGTNKTNFENTYETFIFGVFY